MMGNIIVGIIILAIIGLSIAKVVRAKKSGVKCIGCPHGGPDNKDCSCNTDKANI